MRSMYAGIVGLVLVLSFGIESVHAEGWVSPATGSDVENLWANIPNAIDGNTATYASDQSNRSGDGSILELQLAAPVHCGRLRVNADFGYGIVDAVTVAVLRDGTWSSIYTGAINDAAYSEITFDAGQVSAVRFNYHYLSGGYYFWLYELSCFDSPPIVNAPAVETLTVTDPEQTTAIFHGKIDNDGGAPCSVRFEYGETANYGTDTPWTSSYVTAQTFGRVITGLSNGVTYHFRVQAQNSEGSIVSGGDTTFTTAPPPPQSWVSPTGHNDPDSVWQDPTNAYDDEDASFARTYHNIYADAWGSYLYLTHAPLQCDWIRFKGRIAGSIDAAQVDIFDGNQWTTVFDGGFTDAQWMEVNFPQALVSQARVRFHVANTNEGLYWQLYEFDFHTAGIPRAPGWVSPTSGHDAEGIWVDIPKAFDGNVDSYAQDWSNRAGDGSTLQLDLDSPIHCGRVRVNADFGYGIVDSVRVEVLRNGSWLTVLNGAIDNAAYTEIPFAPGEVSSMRFTYHYLSAGWVFWLYEASFYSSPQVIVSPTVTTLDATSVEATSAILHGKVIDDGGDLVQYRFEYGPDTNYGLQTPWGGSVQNGQMFGSLVTGLTNGVMYHFHVQAKNSEGTIVSGLDDTFTTAPASSNVWLTPTGFVTPPGDWENVPLAIDDELNTFARELHNIFTDQWGSYVLLTHSSLNVSGIRFQAKADSFIDMAEVGLSNDGVNWTTVFQGPFTDSTWKTVPFDPVVASQFRVRFHTSTTAVGEYFQLYEFNFTGNRALAGPFANPDLYSTNSGQALSVSAPGVLANDTDPNNAALTAIKVTNPANGTVTLNADGSFVYTPNTNFAGTDIFTYRANNGTYDSNVAMVTIMVTGNQAAPTAVADNFTVSENSILSVPAPGLLGNDTDPNHNALTAIKVTDPANGTVSLNSDGSFTYIPNNGFFGNDSFSYKANNGTLDSNVAAVSIYVSPAPIATDEFYATDQNIALHVPAPGVLAGSFDPNSIALVALKVTNPASGIVTLNSDGSFVYTPNAGFIGMDSFTFKANNGAFDSSVATAAITVSALPVAVADSYTASSSSFLSVPAPGVLANDISANGNILTAIQLSDAANGNVFLNPDGSFLYLPFLGFQGTNTFTYKANDGIADSNTVTVTITVSGNVPDTTPPVVYVPPDVYVEAAGPTGTFVTFPPASALDDRTPLPAITYLPLNGSIFPIGTTPVLVSARDAAGNVGTGTFKVVVQDTTPPTITPISDITVNSNGPTGATVTFATPQAHDAVTSNPIIVATPPSGSLFPIGTTAVTVTATDTAGNIGAAYFNVTVLPHVQYTVTLVDGATSVANGINDSGQIVGSVTTAGTIAVRWDVAGQSYTRVPLHSLGTGTPNDAAFGINASGLVVGQSKLHAALWNAQTPTDLLTLTGGFSSIAYAINDSGLVAGHSDFSYPPPIFNFGTRAFLWNGTMTDLGTLTASGSFSEARAFGHNGKIVGSSQPPMGGFNSSHAVVWTNLSISDLGTLPNAQSSAARAISTAGDIAGFSNTGFFTGPDHAVLWPNGGAIQDIGALNATYPNSYAYGINLTKIIVGQATDTPINPMGGIPANQHAVVWKNNVIADLNTLIPANSGWVLQSANAINNPGQIVGFGTFNGVGPTAFLLTPAQVGPAVQITSPATGSTLPGPAITVNATGLNVDGSFPSIQFFDNGVAFATVAAPPYTAILNTGMSGQHTIAAVATDDNQRTAVSSVVVTVTLNKPPSVQITSPLNGTNFAPPANISITVNASDSDGFVTDVIYYANGVQLADVTTAPFSFNWNGVPEGSYVLVAEASDNGGAVTFSGPVTVIVKNPNQVNPPPPPPAVLPLKIENMLMAAPAGEKIVKNNNKFYTKSAAVIVSFSVSGGSAPYNNVGVNGTPAFAVGPNRFTVFLPVPEAEQAVTASAFDQVGNFASLTQTLVSDRTPPAIQLTTPLKPTTIGLSCLLLGMSSLETYTDPTTQDPDALRNVFGASDFAPQVQITDNLTEPAKVTFSVREVDMDPDNGIVHDFTSDPSSQNEINKSDVTLPPTADLSQLSKPFTAPAGALTANLEDYVMERYPASTIIGGNGPDHPINLRDPNTYSVPADNQLIKKYNKSYQLFVTATDFVGNSQTQKVLDFALKRTGPVIRAIRIWSPLLDVTTDFDVYQMYQGQTRLKKSNYYSNASSSPSAPFFAHRNAYWRLATPVPFGPLATQANVTVSAQDIAGNWSSQTVTAQRLPVPVFLGEGFEQGIKRPLLNDSQILATFDANGNPTKQYELTFDKGPWVGLRLDKNTNKYSVVAFTDATGYETRFQTGTDGNNNPTYEYPSGPIAVHPYDPMFNPKARMVIGRTDEYIGTATQLPGRVYDLTIPRVDFVPSKKTYDLTKINNMTIGFFGFDDPRGSMQPSQSIFEDPIIAVDPNHHLPPVTIIPPGLGPLFLWPGTDKTTALADTRIVTDGQPNTEGLAEYDPTASDFTVRLAGIPRYATDSTLGFQYSLEFLPATQDDVFPPPPPPPDPNAPPAPPPPVVPPLPQDYAIFPTYEYPGGFNQGINFLRVDPSIIATGQEQSVTVTGIELAWPGETVDATSIKFAVHSTDAKGNDTTTDVTASTTTDPTTVPDKIVVKYAVGVNADPTDFSGKFSTLSGGQIQKVKIDFTVGPNVPTGIYDIQLSTPGGLSNFTLDKVLRMIEIAYVRPDGTAIASLEPITTVPGDTLSAIAGYYDSNATVGDVTPPPKYTYFLGRTSDALITVDLMNSPTPATPASMKITFVTTNPASSADEILTSTVANVFSGPTFTLVVDQYTYDAQHTNVISFEITDARTGQTAVHRLVETGIGTQVFQEETYQVDMTLSSALGDRTIHQLDVKIVDIFQDAAMWHLTETSADSRTFNDAQGHSLQVTDIKTDSNGAVWFYISAVAADMIYVNGPNEIPTTSTTSTNIGTLFINSNQFDEGFASQPNTGISFIPSIPDTAKFRIRITDPSVQGNTLQATLKGLTSTNAVADSKMITLTRNGNAGSFLSEITVGYSGSVSDAVKNYFSPMILIDPDKYEVEYGPEGKEEQLFSIIICYQVTPKGGKSSGAKDLSTLGLDNTKRTKQIPLIDNDDQVDLFPIIKYVDKQKNIQYFWNKDTKITIGGKQVDVKAWPYAAPQIQWLEVAPVQEYQRNVWTGPNAPVIGKLNYQNINIANANGWSYTLPSGLGTEGVKWFSVKITHQLKDIYAYDFERRDTKFKSKKDLDDKCISNEVFRITRKGNNPDVGNKKFLDIVEAHLNVPWDYASNFKQQAVRYVGTDCAKNVSAAFREYITAEAFDSMDRSDDPGTNTWAVWVQDTIKGKKYVSDKFTIIKNCFGPKNTWQKTNEIPRNILKPGDILLLGYPNTKGLWRPEHGVVFKGAVGKDGNITADDKLIYANTAQAVRKKTNMKVIVGDFADYAKPDAANDETWGAELNADGFPNPPFNQYKYCTIIRPK